MSKNKVVVVLALVGVIVGGALTQCRAEDKGFFSGMDIKLAGDAFFATYGLNSPIYGGAVSPHSSADGTIIGEAVTVGKGPFSLEFSRRSGKFSSTEISFDRTDMDLRFTYGPEKLHFWRIQPYFNLGWLNSANSGSFAPKTFAASFSKDSDAGYLGATLGVTILEKEHFRLFGRGEADAVYAFGTQKSKDLATTTGVFGGTASGPGANTKLTLVADVPFSAKKFDWTIFAEGGWQYEVLYYSGRLGTDTYYGPYVRAGVRFLF